MDGPTMRASVERDLEMYGLDRAEARALLGLLGGGPQTVDTLAARFGIDRDAVRQLVDRLRAKGLAEPVAGDGTQWTAPDREVVLGRLLDRWEDHVQMLALRMDQTRRTLAELVPEPLGPDPALRVLAGGVLVQRAYEGLLRGARTEVLAFNRPPYGFATAGPSDVVLDLLVRHVETRVLYQRGDLGAAHANGLRQETAAYVRAGLQTGMVDELPVKMAVVDQRFALMTLCGSGETTSGAYAGGFPSSVLVDDAGLAQALAATFEYHWQRADSCVPVLGMLPD